MDSTIKIKWKTFDYKQFHCGLHWLYVLSPDVEIDIDNSGRIVGQHTGKTNQKVVMCWIEQDVDGNPVFDPVDAINLGLVHEDETVSHYASVKTPVLPRTHTSSQA